jgi:hypothetical protein
MRKSLGRRHEVHGMPQTIRIQLDEGTTETLEVTDLGSGIIRLEATPTAALQPLYRGDTLEVATVDSDTVRLVRIVERAPFNHESWIVARGFPGSKEYGRFVQEVEAAGGTVEHTRRCIACPPSFGQRV